MSFRDSRGYRILLWSLTLACVLGAGYLGYKTFFSSGSSDQQSKKAEAAYARGLEAYKLKNWSDAVTRFDEARLLCDKALQSLAVEFERGRVTAEQKQSERNSILWIKTRAIRDYFYAKSQVDGSPIPESLDAQTGEYFRPFVRIPDLDGQNEAIAALLEVAKFGSDPEPIKDALRASLVQQRINWPDTEPLLRKAIELNPKDSLAHYYLARFDFEQPSTSFVSPEKKSADRIERAREHLAAAKQSGSPYWRTIGLEASMYEWTIETAAARKLKPADLAAAERAVDQLLFEVQSGAIAVASRGEKLNSFGSGDLLGLRSTFEVAAVRAYADAGKSVGPRDRVRLVADAALLLAKKFAEDPSLTPYRSDIAAMLVDVARKSQRHLARSEPNAWREYVAAVDAQVNAIPEATKAYPKIRLAMAEIAIHDGEQAQRAGDSTRAKELMERALSQAEEGLKAAEEARLPTVQIDEFHVFLAEWELLAGKRGELIEPRLIRLRESANPAFQSKGQFCEAVVAYRQGRLAKSLKILQNLANDRTNKDNIFKANLGIADLAAATGDPNAVLTALREVELVLQNPDSLSNVERAWAGYYIQNPDSLVAGQIRATLELALQVAARYSKENSGRTPPADLTTPYEASVEALRKKLHAPSFGDRVSRLAIVNYLIATNRRDVAEARLAELAAEYPDKIDVLRRRVELLAAPQSPEDGAFNPNGVAAADAVVRKFLKDYPFDKSAKLFYAEWLVSTDRGQKAIDFLKDPTVFPGGRTQAFEWLLARAFLSIGERDEAQKVLSSMSHNPVVDAVLIQAAATREASDKQLKEALGRYEDQGFFRIYDAELRLGEGKYEEALRDFSSAVEFTQVGQYARRGIYRTLLAFVSVDPVKARAAAIRLAEELPDEPRMYLAAAQAALALEDVGTPEDSWQRVKSMYAAANRWEAAAQKSGVARPEIIAARALFRLDAGDLDAAKREATTGLSQFPTNVPLMLLLADFYLMPTADPSRSREFYDAAAKENPKDPRLPYVDAKIKARSGDWAAAAAVYEKLATEKPQNSVNYSLLVAALEECGQKDAALRWAREWLGKLPYDADAVRDAIALTVKAGMKADAVKLADEFVARAVDAVKKRLQERLPQPTKAESDGALIDARADALIATARGFFRGKAYAEAEERTREVLKTHPNSGLALVVLADAALAQQQWDKALVQYLDILKANPRHFVAGNNAAWILSERKNKPEEALVLVEDIRKRINGVAIAPERLPAEFLDTIGGVYLKLNRPERYAEMRTIFEAAAHRYPSDPRMFLFLGQALTATGEKSRALENLDAAIRLAGLKNGLPDDQNERVIQEARAARMRIRG